MEPSIVISLSLKPSMQIKPFFAVEPAPVYQLTAKRNSTCVQLSWRHRQTRRDKVYRVDFRRGVETEWQVSCSVTCTLDVGSLLSITCTGHIGVLLSITCTVHIGVLLSITCTVHIGVLLSVTCTVHI